jgi:hypothetical protein
MESEMDLKMLTVRALLFSVSISPMQLLASETTTPSSLEAAHSKSLTMSTRPPYHYDFKLEKGAGVPVCDAYLARLRATEFPTLPHCGRPENTAIAGFKALNWVPLTKTETLKLFDPIEGLLFFGDPGFVKMRAARGQSFTGTGSQSAADRQDAALRVQSEIQPSPAPYYFRFDPHIDINNDGIAEDVIMWKQSGLRCGNSYPPAAFLTVAATYFVVLNERKDLDVERTRELLEWPNPPSVPKAMKSDRIRFMAHTFGVFNYKDEYYFDAFYPSEGNLSSQYEKAKGVTDLLRVFQRKGTSARALCEIRWFDRPQR